MKRKLFCILAAVLLLTPWPVAYAYENSGGNAGAVTIEVAPSGAPTVQVYGGAIGGIPSPVDLFYVNTGNTTADIRAGLYLTNADELVHRYRYLILKVGVYRQTSADTWEKALGPGGGPLPETYITMQNGRVEVPLPAGFKYKVTIDGGSFNALAGVSGDWEASPRFYMTAE